MIGFYIRALIFYEIFILQVILDIPPAHSFGIRHSPYICNLKDAVY